ECSPTSWLCSMWWTCYSSLGSGLMSARSNSRSSRSRTISMCRRPRKPQRKPKPSACEVSRSVKSAARVRRKRSRAERLRGLRLVEQCGVVELQALERVAQLRVLVRIGREEPGEDHWLHFLVAPQALGLRGARRTLG